MFHCISTHVLFVLFVSFKAPTKEERNTCFAAIQIGERYCGFAFSKGDDPARVQLSTAGSRTTTRLLLHKGKGKGSKVDVEMFGYDARETHITKGNSSSYIYFDELIFIEKVSFAFKR